MSRVRGIARVRRGIWIGGLVVRQWLHVARSVKTTFEAESKRKVGKEEKMLGGGCCGWWLLPCEIERKRRLSALLVPMTCLSQMKSLTLHITSPTLAH